ncbi:hypothetical protein KKC60_01770 [Patescibacteria group bacterium]|nr:hypothetical protein [Patescibacteria group bacterium]
MEPDNRQHAAKELIEKSQKILLVTKEHPSDDSVGSLLAMGLVLEKLGKEIDLVTHGPVASNLAFLSKHESISQNIETAENLVISLDISKTKVSQFSYDFDNDGHKLNIFITPEDGKYDPSHISTVNQGSVYDLIFIIDSLTLEALGPLYENNKKVFFETPIINIGAFREARGFGEVNLISEKAASTAEVVFGLIEFLGEEYLDKNVATGLLSGIISKTRSFQSQVTTPQVFNVAASLVSAGADQQKIVQNLFKNKSLNLLKLWGRALSRVEYNPESKIVVTRISKDDFSLTSTKPSDLRGLEEELLATVGEAKYIVILHEVEGGVRGSITVEDQDILAALATSFEGTKTEHAFDINTVEATLEELTLKIIRRIKEISGDQT